jgi:hypothetical protein
MGGLFSSPDVQKAPEVKEVQVPIVNQEQVDRNTSDIMRRRKGTGATITDAGSIGTTAGSVASKALLG